VKLNCLSERGVEESNSALKARDVTEDDKKIYDLNYGLSGEETWSAEGILQNQGSNKPWSGQDEKLLAMGLKKGQEPPCSPSSDKKGSYVGRKLPR